MSNTRGDNTPSYRLAIAGLFLGFLFIIASMVTAISIKGLDSYSTPVVTALLGILAPSSLIFVNTIMQAKVIAKVDNAAEIAEDAAIHAKTAQSSIRSIDNRLNGELESRITEIVNSALKAQDKRNDTGT